MIQAPTRYNGDIRMPFETKGEHPSYSITEATSRPLTEDERIKYNLDQAVTPDKIRALLHLPIREIAQQLGVGPKVIVTVMARNGISKNNEKESAEMARGKLSVEDIKEMLEQGRTCDDINQEFYPHKPGMVLSLARRKGLVSKEPEPGKKRRKPKTETPSVQFAAQELTELEPIIDAKEVLVEVTSLKARVEELKGMVSQMISEVKAEGRQDSAIDALIELGTLIEVIPNLEPARDLSDRDAVLLKALGYIIKYLVDAKIKTIDERLDIHSDYISQVNVLATKHRHQFGPGTYCEVPVKA